MQVNSPGFVGDYEQGAIAGVYRSRFGQKKRTTNHQDADCHSRVAKNSHQPSLEFSLTVVETTRVDKLQSRAYLQLDREQACTLAVRQAHLNSQVQFGMERRKLKVILIFLARADCLRDKLQGFTPIRLYICHGRPSSNSHVQGEPYATTKNKRCCTFE